MSTQRTSTTSTTRSARITTILEHDEALPWLDAYLSKCFRALGLHAWGASVEYLDQPNPDNPSADATAYVDGRYLKVRFVFRRGLMDAERPGAKILACHEALHVAHWYEEHSVEQIVNLLLPDKPDRNRKHIAFTVLDDWKEHAITREATSLARVIDAWDGDDSADSWGFPADDAETGRTTDDEQPNPDA